MRLPMIHEEAGGLIKSCLGLRSVMRWLRCYFFFYPTARSIRVGSDGVEVIVELARDGLVDGRVEGGRRRRRIAGAATAAAADAARRRRRIDVVVRVVPRRSTENGPPQRGASRRPAASQHQRRRAHRLLFCVSKV